MSGSWFDLDEDVELYEEDVKEENILDDEVTSWDEEDDLEEVI